MEGEIKITMLYASIPTHRSGEEIDSLNKKLSHSESVLGQKLAAIFVQSDKFDRQNFILF